MSETVKSQNLAPESESWRVRPPSARGSSRDVGRGVQASRGRIVEGVPSPRDFGFIDQRAKFSFYFSFSFW